MNDAVTLKFYDFSLAKKIEYMELSNKIDTRLAEKFVKKVPLRLFMAVVTGGTSLIFASARQSYQVVKKNNAINAVKAFVEKERKLRSCEYVEWNSFPESHIVIGGEAMKSASEPATCPLCKRDQMRNFVADGDREIFSCSSCSRIIVVRVSRVARQPEEVLIPGVFAAAIPFTGGIDHLGDLAINTGELISDVADGVLDIFA
jgi:hypothetical protein